MIQWRDRTRASIVADQMVKAPEQPLLLPRSPDGWCYLYVIRCGDALKIGRAINPHERVSRLQTGQAEDLTLLAAVPIHAALEPLIHRRFAHLRINGEWFSLTEELAAFVEQLQAGKNPVAMVWFEQCQISGPPPVGLRHQPRRPGQSAFPAA